MNREDKRLRQAGKTMRLVADTMLETGVPIDSCLLAAELCRNVGRELGYRARLFPSYVQAFAGDVELRSILGELSEEARAAGRYAGHAVALWDDRVLLDATAPQLGTPEHAVPGVAFPVTREFARREEPLEVADLPGGVRLVYSGFDDGGDWARGLTSEVTRGCHRIGRALALKVVA